MAHRKLKGRKKAPKLAAKAGKVKKQGKVQAKANSKTVPPVEASSTAAPVPSAAGRSLSKAEQKEAKLRASLERQHKALYSTGEKILLVGEGNFSFARALCQSLGSGEGVYATAFDGEAVLNKKYPDAAECRKEVEEKFGATTLVGVDATMLHKIREFRGAFAKIIWNFPHLGKGESDMDKSIGAHRKLLMEFFASAARCLNEEVPGASVHVALKVGEPYKSWKIVQTARAACQDLDLRSAVSFAPSAWPGYAHRRTQGFEERFSRADSEEIAKGAKVYVFSKKQAVSNES